MKPVPRNPTLRRQRVVAGLALGFRSMPSGGRQPPARTPTRPIVHRVQPVERLLAGECGGPEPSGSHASRFRDATIAPIRPDANDSPVAIVRTTSGPLALPTRRRTRHAPKQTALIASRVSFSGEIQSCHAACCFRDGFMRSLSRTIRRTRGASSIVKGQPGQPSRPEPGTASGSCRCKRGTSRRGVRRSAPSFRPPACPNRIGLHRRALDVRARSDHRWLTPCERRPLLLMTLLLDPAKSPWFRTRAKAVARWSGCVDS